MSQENPHGAEGMDEQPFTLKGGREGVIRGVRLADAPSMLAMEIALHERGDGTMQLLDEISSTVAEQEAAIARFIDGEWKERKGASIVAEVDGEMAGELNLKRIPLARLYHNARIGLGVSTDFQGMGVGRALMEGAIRWAHMTQREEDVGVTRLELSHIGDNERAHALYESMGFRQIGVHTNKVRDPDGYMRTDIDMELLLD